MALTTTFRYELNSSLAVGTTHEIMGNWVARLQLWSAHGRCSCLWVGCVAQLMDWVVTALTWGIVNSCRHTAEAVFVWTTTSAECPQRWIEAVAMGDTHWVTEFFRFPG